MGGEAFSGWLRGVVHIDFCRERGPVVAVEDGSAEEVDVPGPVGAFIVVAGGVEAEPAAALLHVGFEVVALCLCVRSVVEPEDEVCVGEAGGV